MSEPAAPPPSYFRRLADPAVRGYVLAAGGALLVLLFALFQAGGTGAALAFVFAAPGLLFRWTPGPIFTLVAVLWLQVFPFGVPMDGMYKPGIRDSHFLPTDIVTGVALVAYLAAQFRLYSLTDRATPVEGVRPTRRRRGPREYGPTRPADGVTDKELGALLGFAVALVIGGQLLWLLASELEVSFGRFPPVRLRATASEFRPGSVSESDRSAEASRFLLIAGGGLAVACVGRLVFGLWRLNRLTPLEGRLTLLDDGWYEYRREAARLETWRWWGIRRGRGRVPPLVSWAWVGRAARLTGLVVGVCAATALMMFVVLYILRL